MSASLSSAKHEISGTALFSECRKYRYLLTRQWHTDSPDDRTCLFIMLNPSIADADTDDPTIVRCINFANRWNFSRLHIVNLFALRATNPAQLTESVDPVGSDNDRVIREELDGANLLVTAWGNHGVLRGRADEVRKLIAGSGAKPHHLGLNMTGEPRHPLYVSASTRLSPVTGKSPA